jgi:hypothetical protein
VLRAELLSWRGKRFEADSADATLEVAKALGLAIPQFVVDAPHGGGKIPLLPAYIVSTSPTHTVLRNFEGMLVSYPEPHSSARPDPCAGGAGVWDLASGRSSAIIPSDMTRMKRRRHDDQAPLPFARELAD